MESDAIARDIEELEGELSDLRSRVETDSTSFTELESQLAELRERLAQTEQSVRDREDRLAGKQAELAEAKWQERLAAYDEDLAGHRDAAARVTDAAAALLAALDAYDNETVSLRKLAREMREAFGDDERVAQVEAALANEPEELARSWEEIVAAVSWRVRERAEVEEVTPEPDDVAQEPQPAREERPRTRIMEYFGRS